MTDLTDDLLFNLHRGACDALDNCAHRGSCQLSVPVVSGASAPIASLRSGA